MSDQNNSRWSFYGWMAAIAVGILIGIWGAVTLLIKGHVTAGTNDQIIWGVFVPTYLFFVAASAGCVIVSLGYVFGIKRIELIMKRAIFLAIVTLLAGGILIILDLGSPQNAFYFLISPNLQSPLWWMSIFYPLFLILVLIQFHFINKRNAGKLRVISILAALSAIVEHSTLGAIFGFAFTRTYFGGAFSPVYYILIAIVIGTALLLFVTTIQLRFTKGRKNIELARLILDLGKFLGIVVGITVFFTIWKDLTGLRSTIETTALAYEHILSTWWYWVIVILMGLIIPGFLLLNSKTRNINGIIAASILVLVGMFAARIEFTLGAQIVPVLQDLKHLQYPLGTYSPTFVEIAVDILAFSVAALLYTIGSKKLALEDVPRNV